MDTSETYIKMCEKALEIQEGWLHEQNDFYILKDVKPDGTLLPANNKWAIWLPRQDQLQGILHHEDKGSDLDKYWSLQMFDWATDYSDYYECVVYTAYANQFNSMEQLWLAFVMFKKYSKVWDGEQWQAQI